MGFASGTRRGLRDLIGEAWKLSTNFSLFFPVRCRTGSSSSPVCLRQDAVRKGNQKHGPREAAFDLRLKVNSGPVDQSQAGEPLMHGVRPLMRTKSIPRLCAVLLFIALHPARALEPISSYHPPAETVLDGKLGFPPSPPVDWKPEPEGFVADRLFHVPASGVHPRILFAPEDLPAIRERVRRGNGQVLLEITRQRVAKGIDQPGTWENRLYQLLLAGKADEFAHLFHDDNAPAGPPGSTPPASAERQPAVSWGSFNNAFVTALEAKAFLALLDDDRATGTKLAAATTGYARYLAPRIDAVNAGPEKDSYWRGARKVLGDGEAFGLLYDWTQPWMDADQAKIVRGVLSAATKDHYTLGMDLPPHWRNWNYIGLASHFLGMLPVHRG